MFVAVLAATPETSSGLVLAATFHVGIRFTNSKLRSTSRTTMPMPFISDENCPPAEPPGRVTYSRRRSRLLNPRALAAARSAWLGPLYGGSPGTAPSYLG